MRKMISKEKENLVMDKEEPQSCKKNPKSLDSKDCYPQSDDEILNFSQDIDSLTSTKNEGEKSIKINQLKEKMKILSGIRFLMIGALYISLIMEQNMKQSY